MLLEAYSEPTKNEKFNTLKSEFSLYRSTGQRTVNLQNLCVALLSIKATSTDIEGVFSSATFYCIKLPSRLSDSVLNAIFFLKLYYKHHK